MNNVFFQGNRYSCIILDIVWPLDYFSEEGGIIW